MSESIFIGSTGSTLGPLLFLVYMNTFPSVITDGILLQYADDATLICSSANSASMHRHHNELSITTRSFLDS